jgi:hypothetical protein
MERMDIMVTVVAGISAGLGHGDQLKSVREV